jgi:hypothetical protein
MTRWRRVGVAAAVAVGMIGATHAIVLRADTLVMRNGDEIRGELLSVREGRIEFQERGYRERVIRVDRSEVRRIELERWEGPREGPPPTSGYVDPRGGERPGGLREVVIQVEARQPWTDTGIVVRGGQTVYFEASGRITWGPDRHDGPEGEHDSPFNRGRPIPSRPGAALIGRVGDDAPFFIGADTGPIRVRSSGRLLLGINDDYLQDNRGSFRVIVRY